MTGNQKRARLFWRLHHWVGLKLSLVTAFLFLTGSILVFGHEIDWALRPALRVEARSAQGPIAWAAIAQTVAREAPDDILLTLAAPRAPGFAAIATVMADKQDPRELYLHPRTGALQGEGPQLNVQQVVRQMHRRLTMPIPIGVPLVSAFSLLLLGTLITAGFVYKRWWRGFFRWPRGGRARTAWGDWHRLLGLWAYPFAVIVALTGFWYLIESLGAAAPPAFPTPGGARPVTTAQFAQLLPANLAAAQRAYPELRITFIQAPGERSGAMAFYGQGRAALVRETANVVWTLPDRAEPRLRFAAEEMSAHQRLSEAADPLHFGTWGGLASQIFWFVCGLALCGLALTGAGVYAQRILHEEKRSAPFGASSWRALIGMGLGAAVSLALILACIALTVEMIASYY